MSAHAILVTAFDRPGMMSALTTVLADHGANITHVDIHPGSPMTGIYFEVTIPDDQAQPAIDGLKAVAGVERVEETPSSAKIYGKRIIVMGGSAQRRRATGSSSGAEALRSDKWQWAPSARLTATTSAASASRSTRSLSSANKNWPRRCAPSCACHASSCWCSQARSWAARSRRASK